MLYYHYIKRLWWIVEVGQGRNESTVGLTFDPFSSLLLPANSNHASSSLQLQLERVSLQFVSHLNLCGCRQADPLHTASGSWRALGWAARLSQWLGLHALSWAAQPCQQLSFVGVGGNVHRCLSYRRRWAGWGDGQQLQSALRRGVCAQNPCAPLWEVSGPLVAAAPMPGVLGRPWASAVPSPRCNWVELSISRRCWPMPTAGSLPAGCWEDGGSSSWAPNRQWVWRATFWGQAACR